MKALREFIETEKAKSMSAEQNTEQMNAVLERLEQENFTLTEYDDVVVRQIIERVTVESQKHIMVQFKGGTEVRKEIEK